MTIQDLKDKNLIIFECISGSRAYNLDISTSDTDIKGVFILPKDMFYSMQYIPQIANSSNDIVYYELGKFLELLKKNNPNILELLATPENKIRLKNPIFDRIGIDSFLTKKVKDTFGGYAFTQVRKARGLNKKIVNPIAKIKKNILDFCYVIKEQGSIKLETWLLEKGWNQSQVGLVNIPHFKDMFALFYDEEEKLDYSGVIKKENATIVLLSSIPKNEKPLSHLYFNQDGYKKYCKDYKDYWDWVSNRNEARYLNNIDHGKNYDSKNMMHTFRLLDMAYEILKFEKVIVKRPNRKELLAIRNGEWSYDELIDKANSKMKMVENAFSESHLPKEININEIDQLHFEIRQEWYNQVV